AWYGSADVAPEPPAGALPELQAETSANAVAIAASATLRRACRRLPRALLRLLPMMLSYLIGEIFAVALMKRPSSHHDLARFPADFASDPGVNHSRVVKEEFSLERVVVSEGRNRGRSSAWARCTGIVMESPYIRLSRMPATPMQHTP